MQRGSSAAQQTAETVGDTVVAILDKLAGTKTDLKLTFEDLTFDTGMFTTKMTGSVILESNFAKQTT